ncbi:S-methyl-5-thioribose-1-phosphate isomerase [Rhodotorula toruloides]
MSPTPVDDAPVLGAFRITGGRSFYDTASVEIIDQLLLPHQEVWEEVSTIEGAFDAIKTMKIRGAPAIASLASLGIAAELVNLLNNRPCPSFPDSTLSAPPSELLKLLLDRTSYLLTSRPTAVNLREALSRIEGAAKAEASAQGATAESLAKKVINVAVGVWVEDKERCEKIGNNGAKWILEKLEREGTIQKSEKIAVLTVCNTGSLATSGYGTALGVITSLHKQNRLEHAYFAQTGPYQQGARLTAVELASLGAPNTMVCDTAIGALLGEKRVHLFVAGADRIASNGDTANKISTYQISLLAHHPHPHSPNPPVPVLVAAPLTTLDLSMRSGREIEIEQRPSWEACTVRGRVVDPAKIAKGEMVASAKEGEKVQVETVLVTPPGTNAWNPAFDVTPAVLIEGIVTEVGVAEKKEDETEYDLRAFVEEKTRA